jgi:hypothetical protein
MDPRRAAEHIIAKIDDIVDRGALEMSGRDDRAFHHAAVGLDHYVKALDAISRYLEATRGGRDAPVRSPPSGQAVGDSRSRGAPHSG